MAVATVRTMDESPITVVLADDHAVVRSGLRLLLEQDGMDVVAEAGDVDTALRYVLGHKPDVLVLDLNMPDEPSLPAIPRFLGASPTTRIVMLTMQQEPQFAREAFSAGANAYVLKEAADDELVQAIRAAREGRTYVNSSLGAKLAMTSAGPPGGLTEREIDILRLIALGHTNTEIAAQLFLSVRTVETHRAHIQQKLGRTTRAELVRWALDEGLVDR
jgi:two-component system response regulator NreC